MFVNRDRPTVGRRLREYGFILVGLAVFGMTAARAQGSVEVCRIRVENRHGGAVSVSIDGGHQFSVVGHVKVPATRLVAGFPASHWGQEGCVCATAVHAIRICIAHNAQGKGLLLSIVPREYQHLPDSFGGQTETGPSGIYTDIAASTSIFRNLAPFVGNPVFVERAGVLHNTHSGWSPHVGDVVVIVVERPVRLPTEIDFSNRVGGAVEAIYPGGEHTTVARVEQPVLGVGRYDATSYTGVGRINTIHPGVITISTAKEAGVDISDERRGWERRGGFQIIPSVHGRKYRNQPGVMIVGPVGGMSQSLEGTPPLFSGVIGLTNIPEDESSSYRVEMRVDHGPWEPLVSYEGIDPLLFTAAPLRECFKGARVVKEGVTDFRILFPNLRPDFAEKQLALAIRSAATATLDVGDASNGDSIVRGDVHINVNLQGGDPRLRFLVFLVDGTARGFSDVNSRPYEFRWNTRNETNGRHTVVIKGEDSNGAEITESTSHVLVSNTGP